MTSVKLINHSSSTADWNYYTGNNIRVEAEPAIAGCRIPGYVAARICDPHARPCAP